MTPLLVSLLYGLIWVGGVMTIIHGSVWGWRWTTRLPGGLMAELAKPAPTTVRSSIFPELVLFTSSEHYDLMSVGWFVIRIKLTVGDRYIQIPRGCKAYRQLAARVPAIETYEAYRARMKDALSED